MQQENAIIGLSYISTGLTIMAVCVPLMQGKIKPNALYGVRLPKSFESDENWYKINSFGGRQLIIWSIPMLIAGILALFAPLHNNPTFTLLLSFGPIPFLLVPLFQIMRYSKTL